MYAMNGLTMQSIKHLLRIDSVVSSFLEVSFSNSSDKLSDGSFLDVAFKRFRNSAESGKEHTTLGLRAFVQALSNRHLLTIRANEMSSRHKINS